MTITRGMYQMNPTNPKTLSNLKILKHCDISTLREVLCQKQQGICPICCKELNAPCLDHHHKKRIKGTGQIRGVLCRACNVMLGKIENNCVRYSIAQEGLPAVLRNMATYLEQPHLPYIHPSDAPKAKKLRKSSYNKRFNPCFNGSASGI
jgi:hypothetical protein